MTDIRVPLYERLPEIHRIEDDKQDPPDLLKHYLAPVERAFGAVHANIEALYHDLFIETCDDWVIHYIGDLLGTSHLKGEAWALRADVADTIALRRRKGTLGAIELLTFNLTRWGVHAVELRENLAWTQHLNHQRPDAGGNPPYGLPPNTAAADIATTPPTRHKVIRGGTVTLRQPAMLTLLNTPFDRFAHIADLRPPAFGNVRYNVPNLAIFLWRLAAYRVAVTKPVSRGVHANPLAVDPLAVDTAKFIARFDVHPLGEPVRLFNTHRIDPDTYRFDPTMPPTALTQVDETPGPIATARLTDDSTAGNPQAYVAIAPYDEAQPPPATPSDSEVKLALQLHVPNSVWAAEPTPWSVRGANLCGWENSLHPQLDNREVAIDPVTGRIAIGVDKLAEGTALENHLLLTYTYGAVGPVGAHPISRATTPKEWDVEPVVVDYHKDPDGLRKALSGIQDSTNPIVIEIDDSMTHELNLATVLGTLVEDGNRNLRLNRSLIIRGAKGTRPVIKLRRPLRFRPTNVKGTNLDEQEKFDAVMRNLTVRLEGLYLTRGRNFPADQPLIARAALHSLEVIDCTLDPGGAIQLDGTPNGTRAAIRHAMNLPEPYGFTDPDEESAFERTPKPQVILQRSIAGPLLIDTGYQLHLCDSIIDAGKGVGDDATNGFALSGAGDPANTWGPHTQVSNITVFGRMRVHSIDGKGGIWVQRLEVLNNQTGCLKFSHFSGDGDRLPQHHACTSGADARLRFVSEIFGQPAYGQLAHTTDFRIRERGPGDDAMGAYGSLFEAHKWRNIQIRFREFMPVGVRPLLIAVT